MFCRWIVRFCRILCTRLSPPRLTKERLPFQKIPNNTIQPTTTHATSPKNLDLWLPLKGRPPRKDITKITGKASLIKNHISTSFFQLRGRTIFRYPLLKNPSTPASWIRRTSKRISDKSGGGRISSHKLSY